MYRVKEEEYAYASARIRAMETKLLDTSKLNRMIDARVASDALKILVEAEYGFNATDLVDVYKYENLLTEEMQKTYEIIDELAPNPEIINIFKMKNDFHNVKVILKSEFLSKSDFSSAFSNNGVFNIDQLKQIIKERDLSDLPELMKDAILEVIDTFGRTNDSQVIDLILDKAFYSYLIMKLSDIDNEFLKDLSLGICDLTNIKTFIRIKLIGKSYDFFRKVMLTGGKISETVYLEYMEKNIEEFFEMLKYSDYSSACIQGLDSYQSTGNMAKVEKFFDDYIMNILKRARVITMGVEVLIAYIFAKESELKNVRIIMTGKINGLNGEAIKERLRDSYV